MRTVYLVDDPLKYFCTQSFETQEWAEQYEDKLATIEEQTKALHVLQEEIAEKIKKTTEWLGGRGGNA